MTDQQIQIPFVGGPDESSDPTMAAPGSLLSVRNAQYDLDGQLQPRWGYTHLATASYGLARIQRLAALQNRLYAIDGTNLWNISDTGAMENMDTVSTVGVTHSPAFNTSASFQSWGEAASGGYRVVAWIDPLRTGCQVQVFDIASGAVLMPPITLGATLVVANVQIGVVGTTPIVTYMNTSLVGGVYQIFAVAISLSTFSASAPVVVSGADFQYVTSPTAPAYGFCCLSDRFVVAYESTSGAGTVAAGVTFMSWAAALTLDATTNIPAATIKSSHFTCFGMRGDKTGVVFLAWASSITTLAGKNAWVSVDPVALTLDVGPIVYGPAGSLTFTGAPNRIAVEMESLTQFLICASSFNVTSGQIATLFVRFSTLVGSQVGQGNVAYNVSLASAPIYVAALGTSIGFLRTFAGVDYEGLTPLFGSYFLVDYQTANTGFIQPTLLGIFAPRIVNQGIDAGGQQNQTPLLVSESATTFGTVMPIVRGLLTRNGIESFVIDIAAAYRWSRGYVGREGYFSGQYYDGNRVVEIGAVCTPYVQAIGTTGSGATFQYAVTACWVDAQGNIEESAPFITNTVIGNTTPTTTLVVPCITLSRKHRLGVNDARNSPIFFNMYRTPNLAGGNNNLYLVGTVAAVAGNSNVVNAENITLTDTGNSDASIEVNQILYTQSGELAHNCPETFTTITSYANRIWGIGADQRSVWFSEQYTDGELPAWNEQNILTVDDASEPLTAIGSLYSFLAIFTAHKIYVVYGQGPAPSGANSDLTPPQQLPSPVGCIDPRSLVNTPMGLMFQSARGIEVLGADLSVQFIGLPVNVTTATYPICTSAVLCEDSSTVRFTLTNSEAYPVSAGGGSPAAAGLVLVYDYRRSRWSMHSLTCDGARGATVDAPMQAAAWCPPFGYVAGHNDSTAATFVDTENNAASTDPWLDYQTYFVALKAQTAWIKAADLQGWHKVRRIRALCNYYDAHALTMTFDYDYQVVGESHPYTSQTIAGIVAGSWEQVRAIPGQGKGEAIRVTIATSAPTAPQVLGSGRGCGFIGLAFEVKQKAGGYKNIGSAAET